MGQYIETSAEIVHRELQIAVEWLRDHTTKGGPGRHRKYLNTFGHYTRLLDMLEEGDQQARGSITDRTADIINAIYEGNELIRIYEGLRDYVGPGLTARLDKLVTGPDFGHEEDPKFRGDQGAGRNFAFELLVAATFRSGGLDVELPEDPNGGDVVIRSERGACFIECKRPQTPAGIERSLEKAEKQLDPLINRLDRRWGLICISLSQVINKPGALLDCPDLENIGPCVYSPIVKATQAFPSLANGKYGSTFLHLDCVVDVRGRSLAYAYPGLIHLHPTWSGPAGEEERAFFREVGSAVGAQFVRGR